ncbi:MAG TPA: O-methyltransferase [Streptosporangiaceae bacterium]|nr:O-methyltransferase [Streptosporangiaceae bacterium]
MTRRSEQLSQALHDYVQAHSTQPDEILRDLAAETAARFGDSAGMQIGPEQGTFMTLLARLAGARNAVEVGTFTGYSSICIARGLADGGRLLCCDVSAEWTSVAREYWQRAGLADRIELRLGPAAQTLRELPAGTTFDLAFIDADKTGYVTYWELIVPMIRPGGIILVDNTLSHGRVVDLHLQGDTVQGIRRFNGHARADTRVELVLLPIGDGLTLARKL